MGESTKNAESRGDSSLRESRSDSWQSKKNAESAESSLRGDSHESPKQSKKNAEASVRSTDPHLQIHESTKDNAQTPKFRSIIVGANGLSLGISIVVAIMLGIGAGVLMQKIFGVFWVLFLGVFWGIAAAVLNVYKVYKAELRDFEALANDPKYKNMNQK